MLKSAVMRIVPRKVKSAVHFGPEVRISQLQTVNMRHDSSSATGVKVGKVLETDDMCVSKDIWMCLLSAAIGGIISFLVLKFWNSPQTEATRRPKIPVEHDERE